MSEEMISSTDTREVFVRLLDEGTDVRRPTMAIALGGTRYQLLATDDYDPDEEHWEFPRIRWSIAATNGSRGEKSWLSALGSIDTGWKMILPALVEIGP